MYVVEKEMFHFHNRKVYNDVWTLNNEFVVDDNFEASYISRLRHYTTAIDLADGKSISLNVVINKCLEEQLSKETLIELLKEASHLIRGINIIKREMALEEIRKQKYPELPSRKHSIWLCNENGIKYWSEALSNNEIKVDLYKVLVTGILFKSSDLFFPKTISDYETNLKEAESYWNPQFTDEEQEKRAEYLFQGRLKILKKVDV